MTPLICFYKGDYLISEDYFEIEISESQWKENLTRIQTEYFEHTKIIKINYEFGEKILLKDRISTKEKLHSTPLMAVIVLRDKKKITKNQLKERLKDCKKAEITTFKPRIAKKSYLESLKKTLEGIRDGDIYQLNLTFPFVAESCTHSLDLFSHYHNKFLGNYHAHIPYGDHTIISLSPELFLKREENVLTTRPIKGTSKAGIEGIKNLLNSNKENAELSMIVDLLRNDLNSVSDGKGSTVQEHRSIMDLGDIVHTYSEITAPCSKNFSDILESVLPGGSISGCPKKRACEYISELEEFDRGYYCGTLGWWEKDEFELNILIRSFLHEASGRLFYHAGGGIVIDSTPENEYEEILLKSQRINQ
ncbi:MAG: chorismate-binding protein [Bacteriovoracaceae bacterium]|nr:chorismate-binding protein [Bacteriovoracaceae bacterium]